VNTKVKRIASCVFVVLLLLLVSVPTLRAAWWDRYHVDIVSADLGHITMTYDYPCPWRCNEYGREQGYALSIGRGSTHRECISNAVQNPQPNMISSPRVFRWPFVIGEGFEPGDVACIWWCCQPVVSVMVFHWEFIDIDGAPWW